MTNCVTVLKASALALHPACRRIEQQQQQQKIKQIKIIIKILLASYYDLKMRHFLHKKVRKVGVGLGGMKARYKV